MSEGHFSEDTMLQYEAAREQAMSIRRIAQGEDINKEPTRDDYNNAQDRLAYYVQQDPDLVPRTAERQEKIDLIPMELKAELTKAANRIVPKYADKLNMLFSEGRKLNPHNPDYPGIQQNIDETKEQLVNELLSDQEVSRLLENSGEIRDQVVDSIRENVMRFYVSPLLHQLKESNNYQI